MFMFGEERNKEYTCCVCGKKFADYGNNPKPLIMKDGARACNRCNDLVILYRMHIGDKTQDIETREELDKAYDYYEQLPLAEKLMRIGCY